MDTTDSSMSSGSPPGSSGSSMNSMSTQSSTSSSSSSSPRSSHGHGHGHSHGVSRVARMSLERRSSNPGESPGHSGIGQNPSAAVLMMRRRLSSSTNWTLDVPPNNNNNNNNNNNHNSYNHNQGTSVGSCAAPLAVTPGQSGQGHGGSGTLGGRSPGSATAIRKEREQRLFPNNPVSTLVDDALSQMNLKRSSSAPMINQIGLIQKEPAERFSHHQGISSGMPNASGTLSINDCSSSSNRETSMDIDVTSFTTSFLASLNNPRPRRFSASFCPGSPGPAPSRVSQLRHENATDWETLGEKEFLGTVNMAQSWEDLSLDPMEIGSRRPSISDTLWLTMPPGGSSASSSPAVSPRVLSRFSPSLSSPSPTRKSFTTRRSLSPIAVRPSVLSIGHGVKRKCDWDSSSSSSNNQMDTSSSPQPAAKRIGGLLSLSHGLTINSHRNSNNSSPTYTTTSQFASASHHHLFQHIHPQRESPNSLETGTESSVSSVSGGGGDSPFFRPVDSPMNSPSDSLDSPHSHRKI